MYSNILHPISYCLYIHLFDREFLRIIHHLHNVVKLMNIVSSRFVCKATGHDNTTIISSISAETMFSMKLLEWEKGFEPATLEFLK